jgi:RNA-directed DNA polymerase
MRGEMTKSLPVSKRMVWESYLKVAANKGGAGIDRESIEMFDANMVKNLYKLWNRMSSGSYFPPPVRTVFIPKKQGGQRALGIPTVSDRIAQGVVKDYLEPALEAIFHPSSFGYRPGRSAHDALARCQNNCMQKAWVLDVDIKGFFDNISHPIMMELLGLHSKEKWVLLYVERWLRAGVEQPDGSLAARQKGTPQGGVISPLLANLYLHHAFDMWMEQNHKACPFERYADDIVIHCSSREEAAAMLEALKTRMQDFALSLHPEKTKIVYCKNYYRAEKHDNETFTFLSYSFQPRMIPDKFGRKKQLLVFAAAICNAAKVSIRAALREVLWTNRGAQTMEGLAGKLNPKIRGWINYYSKFGGKKVESLFYYLNELLREWIKDKYRIKKKSEVYSKYNLMHKEDPLMFYHWKLGITA